MNTSAPSTMTPSMYHDAVSNPDPMTNSEPVTDQASYMHETQPYSSSPDADAPYAHSEKPTADSQATVPMTVHERAATAESSIPQSAASRLSKNEDAKRVSKVLKNEGRTDAKVLKAALTELERLQKLHKQAAKDEAAALSAYGRAIKAEHRMQMKFLDVQAKHETAITDLKAREAALEATKEHVRRQADLLSDKEAEVEDMRARKAVEDREREVKLERLKMSPTNVSPV